MKQVYLKIFFGITVILTELCLSNIGETSQLLNSHNKAFNFFIGGETDKAIETYLKTLKSKPDSAEIHHYLGVLYFQIGNGTQAIYHFKKAELLYQNRKDKNSKLSLEAIRNNLNKAYKELNLKPEDFNIDTLVPAEREWKFSGIGFLIGNRGIVLTTTASILGADKIRVKFSDKTAEPVILVRKFIVYKIAILQLTNPKKTFKKPLEFSNNPKFKVGSTVYTVGFSNLQSLNPSILEGKILKENAQENSDKIVQLNLKIKEEHDGGPLFDQRGDVIGLIVGKTMAQKSFPYLKNSPQNASFAIKSSYLKKIIPISPIEKKTNYNSKKKLNSEFDIKHLISEAIDSLVFLEIFN